MATKHEIKKKKGGRKRKVYRYKGEGECGAKMWSQGVGFGITEKPKASKLR